MKTESTRRTSSASKLAARVQDLLWEPRSRGVFAEALREFAVTLWKFNIDRCFLRASALTYTTLLSLVPLLALMFSVLKGLGVQERLEPLLLEHLAAGNSEAVSRILEYVDRTKVGALGAVGLVTLVFTAVTVLGNIELSLNDIWRIQKGRNFLRKVADYIAIVIVGPLLLLASLSLTTTLQSPALLEKLSIIGRAVPVFVKAVPLLAVWLALTVLYLMLPNRRVPFIPALLGGVVGGTIWHLAEVLYIRFQFGVAKYNAIYGALAQLPALMVWLYLSWCIVLFGAELAFIHHLPSRGRYLRARDQLWVPKVDVALALLARIAKRFETRQPPPRDGELITELGLDPAEAARILVRLADAGLIAQTNDEPPRLMPARSPDRTSVAELVDAICRLSGPDRMSESFVTRLRAILEREFRDATWAELSLEEER